MFHGGVIPLAVGYCGQFEPVARDQVGNKPAQWCVVRRDLPVKWTQHLTLRGHEWFGEQHILLVKQHHGSLILGVVRSAQEVEQFPQNHVGYFYIVYTHFNKFQKICRRSWCIVVQIVVVEAFDVLLSVKLLSIQLVLL